MRFLPIFITSLGCLLLNSCFDVREEIWISPDGSGRAEMNYTIPSSAVTLAGGENGLRDQVQRIFDSEKALHLDEFVTTSSGGNTDIHIKASTTSMLSLVDMQENEVLRSLPEIASGFAGEFDVKLDGLAIDFDRRIDLQKTLGMASLVISGEQRQQREMTYIIHLPNKPESHNATKTSDGGHTLIWEYTLGDALSLPISTSFIVKIPIPWWAYVGVALLLIFIVWSLTKLFCRFTSGCRSTS
jgi:hypothetical protein